MVNTGKKPRIFLGSSEEGLDILKALEKELNDWSDVTIWKSAFDETGKAAVECLEENISREKLDLAIFLWRKDDFLQSRESGDHITRDNVILETGISFGALNRSNTIILRESGVKIASDLDGMTLIRYNLDGKSGSAYSNEIKRISDRIFRQYEIKKDYLSAPPLGYDNATGRLRNKIDGAPNVALRVTTFNKIFHTLFEKSDDEAKCEEIIRECGFNCGRDFAPTAYEYGDNFLDRVDKWCKFDSNVGFGKFESNLKRNSSTGKFEGEIELKNNFQSSIRSNSDHRLCEFIKGYCEGVLRGLLGGNSKTKVHITCSKDHCNREGRVGGDDLCVFEVLFSNEY